MYYKYIFYTIYYNHEITDLLGTTQKHTSIMEFEQIQFRNYEIA